MILVVAHDQLPYIMITWSTAVDHEKYTAPCYRPEYDKSDRIKGLTHAWVAAKDFSPLSKLES